MLKIRFTFLLVIFGICGCEKSKLPSCNLNMAKVCIVNTRSAKIYGSISGNTILDTIAPNERKCYDITVSELVSFKLSSGTRYSWPLKQCEEEYPLF